MRGSSPETGHEWTDLALNAPGIGVSYEAARRRKSDGPGADRSWRVGADGEVAIAAVLAELTDASRWRRLRRQPAGWRVLHSVPLGDGQGRIRGDVDHLVIGPPGVITINTKHHRTGRLELDGEKLVVNGRPTEYIRKARREAERVTGFLRPAMVAAGAAELAERVAVRPLIAVVGGRLLIAQWAPGVTVVMPRQLVHTLRSIPAVLNEDEVGAVYEVARRSTTWNPAPPPARR
ncbi:nuclease-related domain-containing protein [Pseudonocardia sp. GCM10023141]|uniref:nuclease-related domain-containing protein n=1 Tax=Pseudonocardia sp. GCM10023141 TaxID=3252653 RepID=UPI0036101F8E